jgi:ADP-heptose:LPS heptosyltransferase
MGNIVLMNAGIAGLKSACPQAQIDILAPSAFAEIMRANGNVDRIMPVAKREYFIEPWKLFNLIRDIRNREYELAINCSDVNSQSSTEAIYTLLSGAKVTAGWKMGRRRIFDVEVGRYSGTAHATQMYLLLFSGILGRKLVGSPFLELNTAQRLKQGPVAGINCGGRDSKRISMDVLLEIAGKIAATGVRVEFILGPHEDGLRRKMQQGLPSGCVLMPSMGLGRLATTIGGYSIFISSDTGPMHLAWALGVPTIAIFQDSEIEKFRPLSKNSLVVDGKQGIDVGRICEHVADTLRLNRVVK